MNRSMNKRCGVWGVWLAAMVLCGGCSESELPTPLTVGPFDDAAAAKSHQERWAKSLGVPVEMTNSIGMRLQLIPAGEFLMGSAGLHARYGKEQHSVRITRPFYLGVYPVTQAQWESVMSSNPSDFKGPDRPVVNVSWDDCQEFIRRLNARPEERGGVYRLPTEAEWEYACRAGSTTVYSFGDSAGSLGYYGWYGGNFERSIKSVGQKRANAWGLYDMHGNVWEWCQDWHNYTYYASSPTDDPQGPIEGSYRVYRGGCWISRARDCRSATRLVTEPSSRCGARGFRLAFSSVDTLGAEAETPPLFKATTPGEPHSAVPSKTPSQSLPDATMGTAPSLAVAPFDAATAKEHQEAWAKYLGVEVEVTNSIGMKLVSIPPGEFLMGSPESDSDAFDSEKPQHTVRITKPFYLGVTEVTQEQYERVMKTNPSHFQGAQLPVERVSWENAGEFCRKLSELPAERSAGRVYRLPTEAEWEYACRAGSTGRWCFGDDASLLEQYAWYGKNSGERTSPVGQKRRNAWGLYDMHGNVGERCQDWIHPRYYASSPTDDPQGPIKGSSRAPRPGGWFDDASLRSRGLRGGSWLGTARGCRSANRAGAGAGRSRDFGFRVAFSSVDQSGQ